MHNISCEIVNALITIDSLKKRKQSDPKCLIQNASLVAFCLYLFQKEKIHRRQVYPNLPLKMDLKSYCIFAFHHVFNSNRYHPENPAQKIILSLDYLLYRAEWINL